MIKYLLYVILYLVIWHVNNNEDENVNRMRVLSSSLMIIIVTVNGLVAST